MDGDKMLGREFQDCIEVRDSDGIEKLGIYANKTWRTDPKHLLFMLSRYKFVSKMLSGKKHVLEIGCADAFGTRIVLQEVEQVTVSDCEPIFIESAKENQSPAWRFECKVHNMLDGPIEGKFDAAYSLDVIEHIPREKENTFISNIAASLEDEGVLIIGTPSLQSQVHASPPSKEGHINCKDHAALKKLLSGFFHNVFIFSMNDEVVHTGFYPMAHYLFALCCSVKGRGV